ncbi:MAG: hypothetical protein O7J95_20610 [Planctomycetota bacterium]|nr:hypothetical protein [Planctomycetota bacterium]
MHTKKLPLVATLVAALGFAASASADFPLPPRRTGNLYLSSFGTHSIYCYGPDGGYLFQFAHPDLRGPRGIAFGPGGELYAAAQASHRVLVFDADGTYRRQFTHERLRGPTGLAFSRDGELYVSSFDGDEVMIFVDERYSRSVSGAGLNGPNCVAFAATGDFYVVSQLDSRVYHFAPSGEFLGSFTGGGLSSAMGAAIFEEKLYVTGGSSDNVVIFDLEGNTVGQITDPEIDGPQGIAFDERGRFSVSSFYSGRIALFQTDGRRLQVFEENGVRVARSIAYLPVRDEGTFVRGDYNRDASFDISDPVALLGYLFLGRPAGPCADAGDVDDSGRLEITDAIFALSHLFLGAPPPPAPFPEPGADPTVDGLSCS